MKANSSKRVNHFNPIKDMAFSVVKQENMYGKR